MLTLRPNVLESGVACRAALMPIMGTPNQRLRTLYECAHEKTHSSIILGHSQTAVLPRIRKTPCAGQLGQKRECCPKPLLLTKQQVKQQHGEEDETFKTEDPQESQNQPLNAIYSVY